VKRRGAGRWLGHPAAGALCRLVLGGIFIYTSVPKLLRPDVFARLVNGYQFLHPDLGNVAGITMPWIELAAGALLVMGILPRSSAAVIAGLLSLFIGAGALALARGLDIECGCFFPFLAERKLSWGLVARDAILLLFALQVLAWPSSFVARRRADQGGEVAGEQGAARDPGR